MHTNKGKAHSYSHAHGSSSKHTGIFEGKLGSVNPSGSAEAKPGEVHLRDPSLPDIPTGCQFSTPPWIMSGNGRLSEYYHFLIDFAPRLLEALQYRNRCPRGSTARIWSKVDQFERLHLTRSLYCPQCQKVYPDLHFRAENLKDAMGVDISGSGLASTQPQFDFLFRDWGPPVVADVGLRYGKPLVDVYFENNQREIIPLPVNIASEERWGNQSSERFLALQELGWKRAGVATQNRAEKREYALLIARNDKVGSSRRSLTPDFFDKAAAFFAKHKVRLRIVSFADVSMKEQITLFTRASMVIGIHGAGFSNIIWSQKGTIVVELGDILVDCYVTLARKLGLVHHMPPFNETSRAKAKATEVKPKRPVKIIPPWRRGSTAFDEALMASLESYFNDDAMAGARIKKGRGQ